MTPGTQSLERLKEASQCYFSLMWHLFFELKKKLHPVEPLELDEAVEKGLKLVDHTFWYSFHFSSNLKVCDFVSNRAKMLYLEFLQMSRQHEIMRQSNSFPTVKDAFNFSLRKSIGTLVCDNHTCSLQTSKISTLRENTLLIFNILNVYYIPTRESSHNLWDEMQVQKFHDIVHLTWSHMLFKHSFNRNLIIYISKVLQDPLSIFAFIDWCILNEVKDINDLDANMWSDQVVETIQNTLKLAACVDPMIAVDSLKTLFHKSWAEEE